MGQEGERKRTTDDVSKRLDDIETEVENLSRDRPGGCLRAVRVVSGMKVARAWSGLWCGTWEPAQRYSGRTVAHALARGRSRERGARAAETVEGQSSGALRRGGPSRGSDDAR